MKLNYIILILCLSLGLNAARAEEAAATKDLKKIIKEKTQSIKHDTKELKKAIEEGVDDDAKKIKKEYGKLTKELERRQKDLEEIIEVLKD